MSSLKPVPIPLTDMMEIMNVPLKTELKLKIGADYFGVIVL